jgi:hypothetical protein
MTWPEADAYCAQKNAFLAEPATTAEAQFVAAQAAQTPNTNWWLGLRKAQDCTCQSNTGGTGFDATLDPASLREVSGPVRATCPAGLAQTCANGVGWKWSFSGLRMSYSNWNTASGEPNGGNGESCVIMWVKGGMKWADWG